MRENKGGVGESRFIIHILKLLHVTI